MNPEEVIRDFPVEFRSDPTVMDYTSELFNPSVRGDEWHGIHNALYDYIWEEYELVLDDYLDWDDYGEWYDSTH